jgi:hypothetical protein
MTIRIIHGSGVGDWPHGVTVELEDRHAQRLIQQGYAVKVKKKDKE